MGFNFDGIGHFVIPNAVVTTTDFDFSGKCKYKGGTYAILGNAVNVNWFLTLLDSGNIKFRLGAAETEVVVTIPTLAVGDTVSWRAWRQGTTTYLTVNGVTSSATYTTNYPPTFDLIGLGIGDKNFEGVMFGILRMSGTGITTREYNFQQDVGTADLPDRLLGASAVATSFTGAAVYDGQTGGIVEIASVKTNKAFHSASNNLDITIAGDITGYDVAPAGIEYSFDNVTYNDLDLTPTVDVFSGTVNLVGQSVIYVRVIGDTGVTDSIGNVTIASCYVVAGDSHAAGFLTNNQAYTPANGIAPVTVNKAGAWSLLIDPTSEDAAPRGSIWPIVASKMAAEGIITSFANVAKSGSLTTEWLKSADNYYPWITNAIGYSSGAAGVVLSLGTNDNGSSTPAEIETMVSGIVDDIFADFAVQTFLVIPPGNAAGMPEIRTAISNVIANNANAKLGGDWSVVNADATEEGDNTHVITDAGAEIIAEATYQELAVKGTVQFDLRDEGGVYSGAFDYEIVDANGLRVTAGSATADGTNPTDITNVYIKAGQTYSCDVINLPVAGKKRGEALVAS